MPKRRRRHNQETGDSGTSAKRREVIRISDAVEQVPLDKPRVPVLFRTGKWSVDFLEWADSEGLAPDIIKHPKHMLVPSSLGKIALSLYGFEGAQRRMQHLAHSSIAIIQFCADSYSKFPDENEIYHVGLRPDLDTSVQLRPELEAAQILLGFRNPVFFKSIVIANYETKKEANRLAWNLDRYIKINPDAEHIRLGPLTYGTVL